LKITADVNETLREIREHPAVKEMTPDDRRSFEKFVLEARIEDPEMTIDDALGEFRVLLG